MAKLSEVFDIRCRFHTDCIEHLELGRVCWQRYSHWIDSLRRGDCVTVFTARQLDGTVGPAHQRLASVVHIHRDRIRRSSVTLELLVEQEANADLVGKLRILIVDPYSSQLGPVEQAL